MEILAISECRHLCRLVMGYRVLRDAISRAYPMGSGNTTFDSSAHMMSSAHRS